MAHKKEQEQKAAVRARKALPFEVQEITERVFVVDRTMLRHQLVREVSTRGVRVGSHELWFRRVRAGYRSLRCHLGSQNVPTCFQMQDYRANRAPVEQLSVQMDRQTGAIGCAAAGFYKIHVISALEIRRKRWRDAIHGKEATTERQRRLKVNFRADITSASRRELIRNGD